MTLALINQEPRYFPRLPESEDEKSIGSTLLEMFINNAAKSIGLSEHITLQSVQTPDTAYTYPTRKIIYISENILKSYLTDNPSFENEIDALPDDPEELMDTLHTYSDEHLNRIALAFPEEISDLELESIALHELGHIACQHGVEQMETVESRYQCELQADLFACRSPLRRKGTIRGLKRLILKDFAFKGREGLRKLKKALVPQASCTHPSHLSRLAQVIKIDRFAKAM